MRLTDIEKNLKNLIEEDINNPQVFNTIHELAYLHIKRRKLMSDDRDADETAILIAEDLYMKILRGEPVYSWIGYINKSCIGYIRKHRKMTSSEIIDATNDYDMMQSIVSLSSASHNMTLKEYDKITDRLLLEKLPELIEEIMEEICRYDRFSSQYTNFVMSAYISLIQGKACTIFLDESESMQFRIAFIKVKEIISEKLRDCNTKALNEYSVLQLFTMEGCQQDE